MERSTATVRSQNNQFVGSKSASKNLRAQRTATSYRTIGAQSSSAQTTNGNRTFVKPRIFDDANNDVTPKPLFDPESGNKTRHTSGLFQSLEGNSTPTDILSNGSLLNTNVIATGFQSFGAPLESSMNFSTNDSNQAPSGSMQEQSKEERDDESAYFFADIHKQSEVESKQTDSTINLKETGTFSLLNLPSICFSSETDDIEKIKQLNQKYLDLCKNKSGNDSYVDRGMNTFNEPKKIKSTQTEKITIKEEGNMCTIWDIYDSYKNIEQNEQKTDSLSDFDQIPIQDLVASEKSVKSEMNDTSHSDDVKDTTNIQKASESDDKQNYLTNADFKNRVFIMERLINLNIYQPKQAIYRGLKNLFKMDEDAENNTNLKLIQQFEGLNLEKLWAFNCPLTRERNVSCMTWNTKNKDILAVGYGKFEYNDEPSGLVCCWSIKNTEYPERFYFTNAGVTALAFSNKYPNLLAVGLFNGNILVYDVRNNNTKPLITTSESDHKHLSPVWNLKWAEKERSKTQEQEPTDANGFREMEVLISISSDGRVTQWMIRKGFESTDYLKLKRITTKSSTKKSDKSSDKSDGLISRTSGGLCFDIWDKDKSIYLCGTEEGFILRCSTSYNEQYLDTYKGHTGPVYKIAWSPFLKNCFISASGDWSLKLWKINRSSPCLTFNSNSKPFYDISWSPSSATLFCAVNETSIELWDLSKSTLDPIFTTTPANSSKLTTIGFSPNSDSLVVGSSDGNLCIYAIKNKPSATNENELDEIIRNSLISQLETFSGDEEQDIEEQADKIKSDATKTLIDEIKKLETNRDEEQTQIEKLEAVEAKINKIKSENQSFFDKNSQSQIKPQQQTKLKSNSKKSQKDDSSSDEN